MYLAQCFNSESINAMALWDGRAVKEYQKPRFRPRPWGSITTGGSWQPSDPPFQKMTRTYTSSSSPCHFLAALKHRAFVWSITVDLLLCFMRVSTGLLPFLCFLFLFWTGCGATLWYWSELTVYVFMSRQDWVFCFCFFYTKSSSENMRNLAGKSK